MSDSKQTIEYHPKTTVFLAGLSPYLKDPANYPIIQKKIADTMLGKGNERSCSHDEVIEMAKCNKCTKRMLERRHLLKTLGFKNAGQYLAWQKIHQEITKRYPLMDWKTRTPLKLK